jgi:hypothetical protein
MPRPIRLAVMTALAFPVLWLAGACAPVDPNRQFVQDLAQALGGERRLTELKSIAVEGSGDAPMLGQNTMPDSEQPSWSVTEYRRVTDLAGGRTSMQQLRTVQFLFAGPGVQRQHQALDGEVAFDVAEDGTARRAGVQQARDRRTEMLHHPVTAVRAALAEGTTLSNRRSDGENDLIDVKTPQGDAFTLAASRTTHLPESVTTMSSNPNLGDVAIVTTFSDYETVSDVKMPRRLTTRIDKYLQFDLNVARNAVDVPGPPAAPDDVKAAAVPEPPPISVTVEPVAKGVWWLAGSGNHRSIVVEFDDHLLLFEVPLNEARSKAVIDAARKLSPKPLTHAVVTHHHFDHSGGLRVAVAEGLTIITQRGSEAFFRELLARPWTIEPDALARSPKDAKFEFVDDTLTLKDNSTELRLYHLLDNPREGTNLFGYMPRERLLLQADLYDNTWNQHLWGQNVLDNIKRRGLAVDRDIPVHGAMEPFAVMAQTIAAKPGR